MVNIIMLIICLVPIIYYLLNIRKFKLDTKTMIVISLFAACSVVLSKIKLIQYPQGGGIDLLSSLPILMIGLLYGPITGMTCGLIAGLIGLMGSAYIIHPAQFMFDYILARMSFGLADICGTKYKWQIFLGCIISVIISVLWSVLSGCIFFADYAGGMNPFIYSLVYNFSCVGVEGILSSIVITMLPLSTLRKVAKAK